MQQNYIPFRDTGYFSSLICDYLDEKNVLNPFYNRFPNLVNFKEQIEEKRVSVRAQSRTVLASVLKKQYQNIDASKSTLQNIEFLKTENTFTITTGHQLNLFTGPLYFLYKIISTINLSKQLKETYPKYNFVPVYWMATEDHDFEEINHLHIYDKKIEWESGQSGAVGMMKNTNLKSTINELSKVLFGGKENEFINYLRTTFSEDKYYSNWSYHFICSCR